MAVTRAIPSSPLLSLPQPAHTAGFYRVRSQGKGEALGLFVERKGLSGMENEQTKDASPDLWEGEEECDTDEQCQGLDEAAPQEDEEGLRVSNAPDFDFLDAVALEVVHVMMDMVNAAEADLPPRSLDYGGGDVPSHLPCQVVQRATIHRRDLLRGLGVFGVEPIDDVGRPIDLSQQRPGRIQTTEDPSKHGVVSACFLTGFARGDRVLRHAVVEVLQHNPPEEAGERATNEKEMNHGKTT